MKRIYYAKVEGYILGKHRRQGEVVGPLSEREARYAELAGLISQSPLEREAAEKPARKRQEPDPAALDRKTR